MSGGPTQIDKDEAIKNFMRTVDDLKHTLLLEQGIALKNILILLKKYPFLLDGIKEN